MLRKIFGRKKIDGLWERRTNNEINKLYKDSNIAVVIKTQRIRWMEHILGYQGRGFRERYYEKRKENDDQKIEGKIRLKMTLKD